MYGIGSYVLGDAAGRQAATGEGYDAGPRVGGGGGAVSTVGSIIGQLFPGGAPATIAAVRGGAGPAGPGPMVGGTDWMSMLMPIALIAGAVGVGYFIIKRLRRRN